MKLRRVERHLAKVKAAGSTPVIRSTPQRKQNKRTRANNALEANASDAHKKTCG